MSDGVLCLVAAAGACEAVYPRRWHVTTGQEHFCAQQHVTAGREAALSQGQMSVSKSPDGWTE